MNLYVVSLCEYFCWSKIILISKSIVRKSFAFAAERVLSVILFELFYFKSFLTSGFDYRSEIATEAEPLSDDELPVQGPIPFEPDDAPWKRSESGIRKL